jgi:aspartyl-tRNA(Asn)/glutamyl-tRNA(Gln) amidotransferase subunit A
MIDWLDRPVREQRQGMADGRLRILDLLECSLARISETDPGEDGLNALTAYDPSAVIREGERTERHAASGDWGPLPGIPIVVKDNIATVGLPTTCASRMLEGYVSPFEATVVSRLKAAGGVIIAKSNMDEFAMGSSTEYSAFGPTRNPIDPRRVPGGSSGGSAAAVGAGMCRIALGSDTAGSVRQPASFCGVVGVKPTYGRVSRFGLVTLASSLDQIGIFGKSVDDAAIALEVIAGRDSLDATCADLPVERYSEAASLPLKGMVVGLPREYFAAELHSGVRARCDEAISLLRAGGAAVREVSLPHTALSIPVYHVVASAEISSSLSRFDGIRYGPPGPRRPTGDSHVALRSRTFGPEVMRRLLLGAHFLSADGQGMFRKARQVRTLIAADFAELFSGGVDMLFTPTTPAPAFELGARSTAYSMYQSDMFTVAANLAGLPALTLPLGLADGLPVGGQIIGPHFGEQRMFCVAYGLERLLAGATV